MKFKELMESDNWDDLPFSSKDEELEFLIRHRKALFVQVGQLSQRISKGLLNKKFDYDPYLRELEQRRQRFSARLHQLSNRIQELGVKNHAFLFVGFRSPGFTTRIRDLGGKVADTVSGKIDYIVVEDPKSTTVKMVKAKRPDAKILTKGELADLVIT